MKDLHLALLLVAVFIACNPVSAFWRLLCKGQLGVVRIDPLTDYGLISDHAHAVAGASNFGFTSNVTDLMASECTSCSVIQDRSAYWAPVLYLAHDNGSFTLIPQVGGMTVYYFNDNNNTVNETIYAFPTGFEMVAGDTRQRNFTVPTPVPQQSLWTAVDKTQLSLSQMAIGFNCLNYTPGYQNENSMQYNYIRNRTFIDTECLNGLRLELMFPSCWDGVNLTSPNHKSHVQYPDLIKTGACPVGFETRLPVLFYETIFDTYSVRNYSGSFVLSNGDPSGYGYHGDFIAGWNTTFLQSAIDTCSDSSGLQQDCPLFYLQSDEDATSCTLTLPDPIKDEDTLGPISNLPGNHPIFPGPAYAPECAGTPLPAAAAAAPSSQSAPPNPPASSSPPVPSIPIPPVPSIPSPPVPSIPPPPMSTLPAVTVASLLEPSLGAATTTPLTTAYTTDGTVVIMVVALTTVTDTATATAVDADVAAKRHLAQHNGHVVHRH